MGWSTNIGGPTTGNVTGPVNLQGQVLEDTTGPVTIPTAEVFAWQSRTRLSSPADGTITMTPSSGSGAAFWQLGGATSAYPGLKRNGAAVQLRLADDSGDAAFSAGGATLSGGISMIGTTPQVTFGSDIAGSNTAKQAVLIGGVTASTYAAAGSQGYNFGYNAIVIGSGASVTAAGSADSNIAIGTQALIQTVAGGVSTGYSFRNTVVGLNGGAQGYRNASFGNGANCSGTYNVAIGDYAATGDMYNTALIQVQRSVAIGRGATVLNNYSVALGQAATTTADHQIMLGTSSETVVVPGPSTLTGAVTLGSTLTATGTVTGSSVLATTALQITGKSQIQSSTDGYLALYNNAGTGFTGLRFGGTASSFPMIKVTSTTLGARLADDSADAAWTCGALTASAAVSGTAFVVTSKSQIQSSADGYLALYNNAATGFTGLRFGGTTASFPMLKVSGTSLKARLADDSADAPITAGAATFSGVATVASGSASAPSVTFSANTQAGLLYDSTNQAMGIASGSGAQGSYIPNGSRLVPLKVDDGVFYRFDDFDNYQSLGSNFSLSGNYFSNTNATGVTATSAQQGVITVYMTSASSGGAVTAPLTGLVRKSSTITWQWRVYFQMPSVLSTSANRYTFRVGSFYYNATAPWAGPYLSYNDNVNSGNWVLNSSVGAGTTTSTNTAIAVPAAATWHALTIVLVNGTYTFSLDGTILGTVTDNNLTSSDQWCAVGPAIQILPSTYTANTYAAMDSFDILVSGLGR